MPTIKEIQVPYITAHEELRLQYYVYGLISEAEHTQLHYQNQIDKEAAVKTASDYVEPEPEMDYKAEILKLQGEIKKIKAK